MQVFLIASWNYNILGGKKDNYRTLKGFFICLSRGTLLEPYKKNSSVSQKIQSRTIQTTLEERCVF